MFSALSFPSLKEVVIGSAIVGGLATVGYVTYKYIMDDNCNEKINRKERFGDLDVSSAIKNGIQRNAENARQKPVIDEVQDLSDNDEDEYDLFETVDVVTNKEEIKAPTSEMAAEVTCATVQRKDEGIDMQTGVEQESIELSETLAVVDAQEKVQEDAQEKTSICNAKAIKDDILGKDESKNETEQVEYKGLPLKEAVNVSEEATSHEGHERINAQTVESGDENEEKTKTVNSLSLECHEKDEKADEIANDDERKECSVDDKEDGSDNQEEDEEEYGACAAPWEADMANSTLPPYHVGSMPGMYIPQILKGVHTMEDFEQTMEALCVFLFKHDRTQEELDEAERHLGWVFYLAKEFLHRLPSQIPDFSGRFQSR